MLTLEAIKVLRETNKTLFAILTQMQNLATTLPEYWVVRATKGVGAVLAPKLFVRSALFAEWACSLSLAYEYRTIEFMLSII